MERERGAEPRPGTKTGRVWEIADSITRASGKPAQRRDVIERCVAEGVNRNTASTQYWEWTRARHRKPRSESADEILGSALSAQLVIAPDGRLVIPIEMRRAMHLDASQRVTARVVDGVLEIVSRPVALARARALVRHFDRGEGSPVDELLRERRTAAEAE